MNGVIELSKSSSMFQSLVKQQTTLRKTRKIIERFKKFGCLIVFGIIMVLPLQALAVPLLQVNDFGQLTGATGVLVNGTLYDVDFKNDSCVNLFDGCAVGTEFTFTTLAEALNAGHALLNQVFVNTPTSQFDDNIDLIEVCAPIGNCFIDTPFSATNPSGVNVVSTENSLIEADDSVSGPFDNDFDVDQRYAVWTPSTTPIPEPSTVLLLGSGLLGLTIWRQKNKVK